MDEDLRELVLDLRRRVDRMLRRGVVAEVDLARAMVRVRYSEAPDEAVTDWLPWLTRRAGGDRTWWAPTVDEGVLILAPSGEMAAAAVLPALYQAAPRGAPADAPGKHLTVYATGAMVEHDAAEKTFTITTAAGHEVVVEDDGDVVVPGTLRVAGNVEVEGNVDVDGNVAADGSVRDGTSTMARMRTIYNAHTHVPALGGPPAPASRM